MIATFNTTILCGDNEWDFEAAIVEACGLDYEKFLDNKFILTKEIFDSNWERLRDTVIQSKRIPISYMGRDQVLGYFILLTGSEYIYSLLKKRVLDHSKFRLEKQFWKRGGASHEMKEERRFHLAELREKIRNHKPGVRSLLSGIDYGNAEEP